MTKMSAAKTQAARMAAHVEAYLEAKGKTRITMTEATTAIWGTSGTGNPNAKRIIEGCAAYGYLIITPHGKRIRYVERSLVPIPQEVVSSEEQADEVQRIKDEDQRDLDYKVSQTVNAIKTAPTVAGKQAAFYGGLRSILGGR